MDAVKELKRLRPLVLEKSFHESALGRFMILFIAEIAGDEFSTKFAHKLFLIWVSIECGIEIKENLRH